jgi:hypothetical protein
MAASPKTDSNFSPKKNHTTSPRTRAKQIPPPSFFIPVVLKIHKLFVCAKNTAVATDALNVPLRPNTETQALFARLAGTHLQLRTCAELAPWRGAPLRETRPRQASNRYILPRQRPYSLPDRRGFRTRANVPVLCTSPNRCIR